VRYGFVIDQHRCIGCHACTVACKEEHDVALGVYRTWVKYIEKGAYPHTQRHFGVLRCNHCDRAPCVEICPTAALFRRADGIVDFDGERCIGCKSCMQACPYDALYIDPRTNTAAKCNFCAHRVEVGLEPACVIVCPQRAIIAGDLDDPGSEASRIVAREKVSARKPEKGTRPKLFYVGIEGDLLRPASLELPKSYLWAERQPGEDPRAASSAPLASREVYGVPHAKPWGKKIAFYLWTKSIAAGALMIAALLWAGGEADSALVRLTSPALALAFTGATALLLVFDLKRPDRFHYLLFKPNPRSWLTIGGYILIAYGVASSLWLAYGWLRSAPPPWLVAASGGAAIAAAGYSAFLFAQAKGRDLWQSPLFLWHLLAQAGIGGSAALLLAGGSETARFLERALVVSLSLHLAMAAAEVVLPRASEDAELATGLLKRGALSGRFWGLAIGAGTLVPLALLAFAASPAASALASLLALAGLWVFEDLWVEAGQAVRLS
jgi:Fe-S-cluster-containing dehydrogenase component/formate-dependent nitrite reductase membrane component NrfD